MAKGGSEELPPGCAGATWLSWRAWPPCWRWLRSVRVVDLADVVGLDRELLVLYAVSRERLWLDLAFNNDRRPGLEGGGDLRQWPPILNLEPIGVLVLGAVLAFPLLVDGSSEVNYIAVLDGLLFGVFAEVAFEVGVVFVAGHDVSPFEFGRE